MAGYSTQKGVKTRLENIKRGLFFVLDSPFLWFKYDNYLFPFPHPFQWKIKKSNSFIRSPAVVFTLSSPLLLASTSLHFSMICITFLPV